MALQDEQRFGSLIGLRQEYEERYIILHKHTFPGVLKRIQNSCIRNYSIFLCDGMLFSYYEYTGKNWEEDMKKIGEDTTTQEWWKLTDPMQEPLKTRKGGERWASMKEIVHFSGTSTPKTHFKRWTCVTEEDSILVQDVIFRKSEIAAAYIHKLSVFHNEGRLYLYSEFSSTSVRSEVENTADRKDCLCSQIFFGEQNLRWKSMQEVFHTG